MTTWGLYRNQFVVCHRDKQTLVVYRIPCECLKVYIGEAGKPLPYFSFKISWGTSWTFERSRDKKLHIYGSICVNNIHDCRFPFTLDNDMKQRQLNLTNIFLAQSFVYLNNILTLKFVINLYLWWW